MKKLPAPNSPAPAPLLDTPPFPHPFWGTLCGLLAALGYTVANICLKAATTEDHYWVSAVKAVPTLVIFGPVLFWRAARSQSLAPPLLPLLWLVASGVFGQFAGNVLFQWALGIIGIALTVPICLGAMISTGAMLGWWLLGERVTLRSALAMVILMVAVLVLSLGAPQAQQSLSQAQRHEFSTVVQAVLATCVSGLAYSLLGVAIRHAAHQGGPAACTLCVVSLAGILTLWPMSYYRLGIDGMLATPGTALWAMLGAGIANALAFLALTESYRLSSIVHVNGLNVTQAAMAALAGVLLFREPLSLSLGFGLLLTAAGLLAMKRQES